MFLDHGPIEKDTSLASEDVTLGKLVSSLSLKYFTIASTLKLSLKLVKWTIYYKIKTWDSGSPCVRP